MNVAMLFLATAMGQLRDDQASQPAHLGWPQGGTPTGTSTIHTLAKLFHYPGLPTSYRS